MAKLTYNKVIGSLKWARIVAKLEGNIEVIEDLAGNNIDMGISRKILNKE